jgi:hypothetical protein
MAFANRRDRRIDCNTELSRSIQRCVCDIRPQISGDAEKTARSPKSTPNLARGKSHEAMGHP